MNPIAAMVQQMLAAGAAADLIVLAVNAAEETAARLLVCGKSADYPQTKVDVSAERRRAADRARQAEIRRNRQTSADSSADAMLVSTLKKDTINKKENSRGRGTRLSADWMPTQADLNFAVSHGWSEAAIECETLKFRNHWTSKTGRDAAKLNWPGTWQNWVLNARIPANERTNHLRTDSASGRGQTHADAVLTGMGRLADRLRQARQPNGAGHVPADHGAAGFADADGEPTLDLEPSGGGP